jgi:diacylglycerol kinase (ATP)
MENLQAEAHTIAYVVNPVAGHGRARTVLADLAFAAAAAGYGGSIFQSEFPGHASELTQRAVDSGATMVIVVGGDGTISEVANALIGLDVTMGILPAGGGNDLARVLGVKPSRRGRAALAQSIRDLVVAPTQRLDVLRVGHRTSLQASGAGLDAHVTDSRSRSRLQPPIVAYAVSAVFGLIGWRPRHMRVTVDGAVVHDGLAFAVTIANTSTYGGGLRIAPTAVPTDGQLDVAIIGDIGRVEALRLFPSVYRGGHVGHPKFQLLRGRHALVESDANHVPTHVDGSITGVVPLEARVVPGAVRVVVPSSDWSQVR